MPEEANSKKMWETYKRILTTAQATEMCGVNKTTKKIRHQITNTGEKSFMDKVFKK